ncbi:MAG: ParB/Srx family N-terminal domain-containing protein [Brevundimonas sp.]
MDELIPYAANSRTHDQAQINQIAASIAEFGFTNPVLVDADGMIIAGHGRVLAARQLGMLEVPVLVLDHLTDQQKRAYVIADNKLGLTSGWDDNVLRAEMEALLDGDFDLSTLGFAGAEIDDILAGVSASSSAFEPNLDPGAGYEPVTEGQILKGEAKIAEYFEDASKQKLLDVMCPHCAKEFHVDVPK